MHINLAKALGQILGGKTPNQIVVDDTIAELKRVKEHATQRIHAGDAANHVIDDLFAEITTIVTALESKEIR